MQGVSVILPCYNGARWISGAIESIFAQTYKDFELIIIDDGSTDNSSEVIAPYLFDKRVHYVRQRNRGFTAAINRGIKENKSDLISFIGCDDLWMPCKLELQLKFLRKHKDVGLVHSSYYTMDSQGGIKDLVRARIPDSFSNRENIKRLFLDNFIGWETVLVKRECFDKLGLLDERMVSFSDHDIWLRIVGNYNLGYLDQPLVKKRLHEFQLTRVRTEDNLEDELLMVRKAIACYPFLKSVMRRKLASLYYASGIAFLHKRDRKKAKRELLKSVKSQPWRLRTTLACIMPTIYGLMWDHYWEIPPRIRAGLRWLLDFSSNKLSASRF